MLLVAAVVAAIAVLEVGRRTVDNVQMLLGVERGAVRAGLLGVIVRRNVLVMLMCMELMLNGVNLSLVTFAQQTARRRGPCWSSWSSSSPPPRSPSRFPSCCCSCARKRALDLDAYADLKG